MNRYLTQIIVARQGVGRTRVNKLTTNNRKVIYLSSFRAAMDEASSGTPATK